VTLDRVYESPDMVRGLRRIALMPLVLAGLAACGSPVSTTPAGATSAPNGLGYTADQLCSLVSVADISAAVGTTVGAGVPSGVNAPSCTWQSSDSSVGVTIAASGAGDVGKIPFGLQGISGAHVTAVPNVGDAAFFAAGGTGPTSELDIRKGSFAITITVGIGGNLDQGVQQAAELAIGTAAAQHM
jgi:hypothetical protein